MFYAPNSFFLQGLMIEKAMMTTEFCLKKKTIIFVYIPLQPLLDI